MWRRTEIYRENIRTGERRWGVVFENYERQLVCSVIGFVERKDAAAFVIADVDQDSVLTAQMEMKEEHAQKSQPDKDRLDPQARTQDEFSAQPGAGEETSTAQNQNLSRRDYSRGPIA